MRDPLAQLVLFTGDPLPLSLRATLAVLDRFNTDAIRGLPEQHSFVVADGGQIPWSEDTNNLVREFRFAITRNRAGVSEPDLLVSTNTQIDEIGDGAFLQVIAWDEAAAAFRFYERRHKAWIMAGSSWDALAPDSRGNGPFASHVNGALNMKELKRPWVHWNSQSARILDTALAENNPLRSESLWRQREGAEVFETSVARAGILRWNNSRFNRLRAEGRLTHLPDFMRQMLDTSTINLASSTVSNPALGIVTSVDLPLTFFFNADALLQVLGLAPVLALPPRVPVDVYRAILRQYDVAVSDGKRRFAGDTHFVFVVPEAAYEDVLVLETLVNRKVMSRQFASALLMVDFQNAVFSTRRASLLKYVPDSACPGDPSDFEDAFVARVKTSPLASQSGAPEHEFLQNHALGQG